MKKSRWLVIALMACVAIIGLSVYHVMLRLIEADEREGLRAAAQHQAVPTPAPAEPTGGVVDRMPAATPVPARTPAREASAAGTAALPSPTPEWPEPIATYVVQPGDTLEEIARRYGM